MTILAQMNFHMFARKLLKQNGVQSLQSLAVKRNVAKLELTKMNVEKYLDVAGIPLLKSMASQEIIALSLLVNYLLFNNNLQIFFQHQSTLEWRQVQPLL